MKSLFGTDGIRGEAGKFPLDALTVRTIGKSLAAHLKNSTGRAPSIVIGRDTRESGEWLENALIKGALEERAECLSAGVITTPGVAYLTRVFNADAGVVISASHNPYHDNGIKIFAPTGKKIADSIERVIEADIRSASIDNEPSPSDQLDHQQTRSADELRHRYLRFLTDEIGAGLALSGLSIVVDCANGASSYLAPALFESLGAKVVAINVLPDGRNINLNCGSLHIESLQARVTDEQADLGVAFDGDADRSLFVDAKSKFVDGDATLWVLTNHLLSQQRLNGNFVVATVMSNIGLEIALRSIGVDLVRTDVGDKYVLDELLRRGGSLGGEQSGHIIMPELSLAGDGMITALCLVRAMVDAQKQLHELVRGFQQYPQTLLNVRVREKVPFEEIESVQKVVSRVKKQLSQNGRLLLRYSGTERLARVMIEGANQSEIEDLAGQIADAIRRQIGE